MKLYLKAIGAVVASCCVVVLLACSGTGSNVDGTKVVPPVPNAEVPKAEVPKAEQVLPLAEAGQQVGGFQQDPINVICAYLEEDGHTTNPYEKLYEEGDAYYACSMYKFISPKSRNAIAYYVDGTRTKVSAISLGLYVNDRSGASAAHEELLASGEKLVLKATGNPLPHAARKAIIRGGSGVWQIGPATVRLKREDYPTGRGYSLDLLIEWKKAAEAIVRMEQLPERAPAAWEELQKELGDSLTTKSRDKLRTFVNEFRGTPEGELAEKESKADGMWTLLKQYERIKNKEKAIGIADEIVKQFPETVSAKLAAKWIENRK